MHIIYVTAGMPFSQAETFFIPEIREIERRGHRVTIVPVRPGRHIPHLDARPLAKSTVARPVVSPGIVGSVAVEATTSPRAVARVAFMLARSGTFRTRLKNLTVLPKAVWLATMARQMSADHIHAQWAGTTATMALVASQLTGIPWSFTAHNWDIPERNLLEPKLRTARFARTIDMRGKRDLSDMVPSAAEKIEVIHLGVVLNDALKPPRASARQPVERACALKLLVGARLDQRKGHRYALEAVAQLKARGIDVLLDCAGDGPLRKSLEQEAAALDVLDRVKFLGLVDHETLLSDLRNGRWDVAFLPCLETGEDREGIPVTLIEAMAAEIAVVATSTGGIPELLADGAGILIPQRDSAAAADALARLAENDELRRRVGWAGRQRIEEQFAVEFTVAALLARMGIS